MQRINTTILSFLFPLIPITLAEDDAQELDVLFIVIPLLFCWFSTCLPHLLHIMLSTGILSPAKFTKFHFCESIPTFRAIWCHITYFTLHSGHFIKAIATPPCLYSFVELYHKIRKLFTKDYMPLCQFS